MISTIRYNSSRWQCLPLTLQTEDDIDLDESNIKVKTERNFNECEGSSFSLAIEDDTSEFVWIQDTSGDRANIPNKGNKVKKNDTNNSGGGSVFCKYCNRTFESEDVHKKHVSSERKRYYCHDHCKTLDKAFTKHEFIDHCQKVGIEIKDASYFKKAASKNVKTMCKDKFFQCETCSELFETQKERLTHYDTDHKNHYVCTECNEGFNKMFDLAVHSRIHNEDDLYQCPFCPKTTQTPKQISSHLHHTHAKNYKCDVCEKRFLEYPMFQQHIKYYHNGEKPFTCDQCGKNFVYWRYLCNHKQVYHNLKTSGRVECSVCGKSLLNPTVLRIHLRRQHSNQSFVCDTCGKTFISKYRLNYHCKIHVDEKLFKCSFCGKKFLNKTDKSHHERTHTGEKPFECSYCGKSFSIKQRMTMHTRLHTGEKPYQCTNCNGRFMVKRQLTNHLKSCKGPENNF